MYLINVQINVHNFILIIAMAIFVKLANFSCVKIVYNISKITLRVAYTSILSIVIIYHWFKMRKTNSIYASIKKILTNNAFIYSSRSLDVNSVILPSVFNAF